MNRKPFINSFPIGSQFYSMKSKSANNSPCGLRRRTSFYPSVPETLPIELPKSSDAGVPSTPPTPSLTKNDESRDVVIASAAYAKAMKDAMMMQNNANQERMSNIFIQNHSNSHCESSSPESTGSVWSRGVDLVHHSLTSFQTFWQSRLNRCAFILAMGWSMYMISQLSNYFHERRLRSAHTALLRRKPLQRVKRAVSSLLAVDHNAADIEFYLQQPKAVSFFRTPISWVFG
eukprot:GHVH01016709.1.p1 GENE.GHVH01016709.1~~GHVH01016709.1.p1  ORF type:complete len:232 (+),score=24.34 GHVH01016709.1:95-790(+)